VSSTHLTLSELQACYSAALTALQAYVLDDTRSRESVFRRVCEQSSRCLEVERVGVWLLADAGGTLRCASLFERTPERHSSGGTFLTSELPNYFMALSERTGVLAETADADPRTNEFTDCYLRPLGIASMMDVPLIVAGEVVGVICHEQVGDVREWSAGERSYAEAVARLLSEDLAHRSAGQASVDAARAGERLARTTGGVAHDFKNLLTIIQGNVELLALNPSLSPAERRRIDTIFTVIERGAKLAGDLMLCARRRLGIPRVVSLSSIVADMAPMLEAALGSDHDLELDLVPPGGKVFIDPIGLERVVMNLVVNARDASPKGTTITVATRDDVAPDPTDLTRSYKTVEVSDRGTGISSELMKTMFDPFLTTKKAGQGTGLGLAVVKEIVERAGGFIEVDSVLNEGTTMRVYLPRISVGLKK